MNVDMFMSLVNNAALLLALGVFYDVVFSNVGTRIGLKNVIMGITVGLIGIALMLNPWELSPGLFFDTRSVLLSIASLFFGVVPAIIGGLIVASYRIYLGGIGTVVGVSVIICSVIVGLLWRKYHEKLQKHLGWFDLYVFGILVHIVMLICMLLLPWPSAVDTIKSISLPVMFIYPIGTFLLGNLLNNQILRKKTQNALKENETKLQSFIDNVPVGIFRINSEGEVIQVNPQMVQIVRGGTSEHASNDSRETKNYLSLDNACSKRLANILREHSYVDNYEYEVQCPDGRHIWLLINARKSNESDDGLFTIDGFALDITIRKNAVEQMLLATIAAEGANRFKSELLANMNHELRTPLNSILGFSDILLEGTVGELSNVQTKYLQTINNSGKCLLDLVNNILELSRIESGTLEFKPELVRVIDVMETVQKRTQFLSSKKGVSIDINVDKDVHFIKADFNKLKSIIYNLVENSIKFTHDGGAIKINAVKNGENLEILVVDNGIGIVESEIQKIFDPFVQVDGSSTRKYGGAGMGLTLVKEYVKMHGGALEVKSELGKGSTFSVTLPMKEISE